MAVLHIPLNDQLYDVVRHLL